MTVYSVFARAKRGMPSDSLQRPSVASEPLDQLYVEREALSNELVRFSVIDKRSAAAATNLSKIDAELRALDATERDAFQQWAASGLGDPPAPLLDARRALLARKLEAQAAVDAAGVAAAAVESKRLAIVHEINAVALKIRERKLAAALGEARQVHREIVAAIAEVASRLMRLEGLRQVLIEEQTSAVNAGGPAALALVREALIVVEGLRAPDPIADKDTVARYRAVWEEQLR